MIKINPAPGAEQRKKWLEISPEVRCMYFKTTYKNISALLIEFALTCETDTLP